jgi:hypothetical protein
LFQLKQEKLSPALTLHGMITKSRLAVNKASLKSITTAFNATLQTCLTQLNKDADHAQPITYSTTRPNNATAEFHANFQGNSALITFANAQLIKRELNEFGMSQTRPATVHQTFLSGTVNIALLVQLEQNSIQKNTNAITAQRDSKEITQAMLVFQVFDSEIYRFIVLFRFRVIFKKRFVVGAKINLNVEC